MPLVLFRIDPLSVLFVALAVAALLTGRRSAGWCAAAGVAAKGWPVIVAPVAWWRNRRLSAVSIVAFTVLLTAALFATPGFREGRGFDGIHLETLVRSLFAWLGAVTDGAQLVTAAGAAYVEAPGWAVPANMAIGGALLVYSRAWRLDRSPRNTMMLAGMATAGLVLASPLLSAQFLLWLTPFLAFVPWRRPRALFIAASVFTIVLVGHWDVFRVWWHTLLLVRNVLLVASVFTLASAIAAESSDEVHRAQANDQGDNQRLTDSSETIRQ